VVIGTGLSRYLMQKCRHLTSSFPAQSGQQLLVVLYRSFQGDYFPASKRDFSTLLLTILQEPIYWQLRTPGKGGGGKPLPVSFGGKNIKKRMRKKGQCDKIERIRNKKGKCNVKGSVQWKLRWVKSGVNRSVGASHCGAGTSFVVLFRFHLGFNWFPFPVSTASFKGEFGNNKGSGTSAVASLVLGRYVEAIANFIGDVSPLRL
jgi:hypothetical protein